MSAPFWVAGEPVSRGATTEIRGPFDDKVVGAHHSPPRSDLEAAVAAAAAAHPQMGRLPARVRADALTRVSHEIATRRDEFAVTITEESGKPLKWSLVEVDRAISTFRIAAEEARRFSPTFQRLDTVPSGDRRAAFVRRVPRGPVLGISPFNFPLNLVAHKVAPAIAVGAPIVVKPAPGTPLTALKLGEVLSHVDLPAGSWSVLPIPNSEAPALVRDPRLPVVSFTGSVPIGWGVAESVPRKHVVLELGGNGAVLVAPDWDDLDYAAKRIATYSMYQAGQSCIAVQRVYIHDELYETLREKILTEVAHLTTGDPRDAATDVGPMISLSAAERVETWINEAVAQGADLALGGERKGTTVAPTVLADVAENAKVMAEEAFGPVLCLNRVSSVDEGIERINASHFGLQAGLFTRDLQTCFATSARIEVGGLIIGDVPSVRLDQMPYGGVKDSGVGREGPASAMQDFTTERTVVLTDIDL